MGPETTEDGPLGQRLRAWPPWDDTADHGSACRPLTNPEDRVEEGGTLPHGPEPESFGGFRGDTRTVVPNVEGEGAGSHR